MNPEARAALERELRSLSDEFARGLPARLSEVHEAWRLAASTGWSDASFDLLYRACHSLAGAGGTFGFDEVGTAARQLTDWLKVGREKPETLTGADGPRLLAGLDAAITATQPPAR